MSADSVDSPDRSFTVISSVCVFSCITVSVDVYRLQPINTWILLLRNFPKMRNQNAMTMAVAAPVSDTIRYDTIR